MAEIEFLTAGAGESELAAVDEPHRTTAWRRHLPTTIAAALWTAAAALCVLAPFREVFAERQGGETVGADGWGRIFTRDAVDSGGVTPAGYHDTRYGAVLVICAAGFAFLALFTAALAWFQPEWTRTPRGTRVLRRGVPAIGFSLFGIAAGTGAAALLGALAIRDRFVSDVGSGALSGDIPQALTPSFVIGPVSWFTLAAAACALAGALAACVTPPPPPIDAPVRAEPPPIWTPPHEDDEMLGT